MSRNSKEQWEDRKYNLVRSLFDDAPFLSPIPKAREQSLEHLSSNGSYIGTYSPRPGPSAERQPKRHESKELDPASGKEITKLNRKSSTDTEISLPFSEFDNDESSHESNVDTMEDFSFSTDEDYIERSEVTSSSADEGQESTLCQPDARSSPVPEIMRRTETRYDSAEHMNTLNHRKYFSVKTTADKRSDFNEEVDEAEISSPELSIVPGSTSVSKMVGNERDCCQEGHRKRRISPETASYHCSCYLKRRKFVNVATQTNFSMSETSSNRHEIYIFFKGNPHIFKLCSCVNHNCC